jgi:hypothetical protein
MTSETMLTLKYIRREKRDVSQWESCHFRKLSEPFFVFLNFTQGAVTKVLVSSSVFEYSFLNAKLSSI